ncbi:MAG: hypothetical protein M9962_15035 [Oligoflexia bacterium]|nr:hypothetical protein [Oligoflexia bacterium]
MSSQAVKLNALAGSSIIVRSHEKMEKEVKWANPSPATLEPKSQNISPGAFRYGDVLLIDVDYRGHGQTGVVEFTSIGNRSELQLRESLLGSVIDVLGQQVQPSYLELWTDYTKALIEKKVLPREVVECAGDLVSALHRRYTDFQLPSAYPIDDKNFELRWEAQEDSVIVQIDDDLDITMALRDKVKKRNYGFDCLRLDNLISIDFESILDRSLHCFKEK